MGVYNDQKPHDLRGSNIICFDCHIGNPRTDLAAAVEKIVSNVKRDRESFYDLSINRVLREFKWRPLWRDTYHFIILIFFVIGIYPAMFYTFKAADCPPSEDNSSLDICDAISEMACDYSQQAPTAENDENDCADHSGAGTFGSDELGPCASAVAHRARNALKHVSGKCPANRNQRI